MYYVIQENLFREYHFNTLIDHLKRYKLDYEIVRYIPFSGDILIKTDRKDIWFFGSVNAGRAAERFNPDWYPGRIHNENFTFEVYLEKYGKHLLNSDGMIQEVDIVPTWFGGEYFVRPTHDTKTFESNIYNSKQWDEYIMEIKGNSTIDIVRKDTKMFYASPKHGIQQEVRCWIVDGKLITASQYRIGKRFNLLNIDNDGDINVFVKDMLKIYQPAKAFVMDVCLYEDEYYILELGCINHCGFYDANMSKLIQALEKTFGT